MASSPYVKRIMIIRHGEKPDPYDGVVSYGIDEIGVPSTSSLVPRGWQRAGALASLFDPSDGALPQHLAVPDAIWASAESPSSRRPIETVSPTYAKLSAKNPKLVFNFEFAPGDYPKMVTALLEQQDVGETVLLCWQHQFILRDAKPTKPPEPPQSDSIVKELIAQTQTKRTSPDPVPEDPWPGDRYDMVLVFERKDPSSAFAPFEHFYQVPQLLLAGDKKATFT